MTKHSTSTKSRCRIDPCGYIGRIYNNTVDTDSSIDGMPAFDCVFSLFVAGKIAIIYAMSGKFNRAVYNDIKKQLQAMGIKTVMWERHKNGQVILRTVRL